jgi:hypothetical protein
MSTKKGFKTVMNNPTRRITIRQLHTVMVILLMVAQWVNILPAVAEPEIPPPPALHQIKVMSRNVYHGVSELGQDLKRYAPHLFEQKHENTLEMAHSA